MGSLGWVLWCPYKKEIGHRDRCAPGKMIEEAGKEQQRGSDIDTRLDEGSRARQGVPKTTGSHQRLGGKEEATPLEPPGEMVARALDFRLPSLQSSKNLVLCSVRHLLMHQVLSEQFASVQTCARPRDTAGAWGPGRG